MSIDDKLVTIAGNVEKVYDKGYSDGEEAFWKAITNNGKKEHYSRTFNEADMSGLNCKGLVKPTGTMDRMFYNYKGEYLPEGMDFSNALSASSYFSSSEYATQLFTFSTNLKYVYDMGLPAKGTSGKIMQMGAMFRDCFELETIEVLRVDASATFSSTFYQCNKLKNLTIEGVIGKNGFNVSSCPLNHDSLMSIISALEDKTGDESGTSWVITLGTENKAKLSEEELKIAEDRNWEVV